MLKTWLQHYYHTIAGDRPIKFNRGVFWAHLGAL